MVFNGKQPLVSIIIHAASQSHYLHTCLKAIHASASESLEIFILTPENKDVETHLNEHSRDKSVEIKYSGAFAAAVNRALRKAKGAFWLVMQDTMLPQAGWLEKLQELVNAGSLPDIFEPACSTPPEAGRDVLLRDKLFQSAGDCIFIRRSVVESTGGFDERFELWEAAVEEFCYRAQKEGFTSDILPDIAFDRQNGADHILHDASLLDDDRRSFIRKWNPADNDDWVPKAVSGVQELSDEKCRELLEEGNSLVIEQKIDEGLEKYRRILKSRPNFVEALHNESAVLYQAGRKEEGIRGLEKAIRIDPTFADSYCTLGLIRESEGRYREALDLFKECVARDIAHDNAYDGYERMAGKLNIPLKEEQVDFVFYTGGMTFDGSTINKRSLGGSESALYYMARHIAAEGYTVKVFNNCDTPGTYDNVEYRSLIDFYFFNRWNRPKVFITSRSFKPIFNNIKADVRIVWLHDLPDVTYLDEYDFSKIDFSAVKLFTLSQSQTDAWMRFLGIGRDSFYITRNGYDPERFKTAGYPRKRHKLVYASRPVRGLEVLLDIFPRIREQVPDAELRVFSYKLSERDKEADPFAGKLDQPGVIFRGAVSQEQLSRELAEARLMVYPSIFKETSCIIAIQAQACGLPIVTTNLAALPETVLDGIGGVIIDGDARSEEYKVKFVNETVRLMRDDSAWEKLSRGGSKRMLDIYTWEKVAKEWLEYITERLSGRPEYNTDAEPWSPRLSLCMIVKNEEQNLPVCLDSVRDIVDEIIIVDTGSTDNTMKIAAKYGVVFRHFDWTDNFSEARNESLKHASGDWILYLDADEKLTPENARRVREVIRNPDIMAVNMIEHIPQEEGNLFKTAVSDYCRLFRNDPRLRFTGRVHEQILPSINAAGGKVLKSDIRIEHWGFGLSPEKKRAREERNLRLLMLEEKDAPSDPFVKYNIGMTYASGGDKEKALIYLKVAADTDDPSMKDAVLSTANSAVAQILFGEDDYDGAWKYAEKAVALEKGNLLAHYIMAGIKVQSEQFAEAEGILEGLAEYIKENPALAELNQAQLYIDLGNCAYKMNDIRKAIDRYRTAEKFDGGSYELLYNLGTCFLALDDLVSAAVYFEKARDVTDDTSLVDSILKEIEKIRQSPEG